MTALRKKAYSRVRLLAWTLELEKNDIVFCPNKNCQFMAFNIDDIIKHNQLCRGDNKESLFYCSVCNKGTYEEYQRNNHILRKHCDEAVKLGIEAFTFPDIKRIISPACRKSWKLLLENKGYIKCSRSFCNFLTTSENRMETHFISGCIPKPYQIFYTCLSCKGNIKAGNYLFQHTSRCSAEKYVSVDKKLIHSWNKQLSSAKNYAKCNTIDCQYIAHDIGRIVSHYKRCLTPPKAENYLVCNQCGGWLDLDLDMNLHLQLSHLERLKCDTAVKLLLNREDETMKPSALFCDNDRNEIKSDDIVEEFPVSNQVQVINADYNQMHWANVNFTGTTYKRKRKRKVFFEPINVKIAKFTTHIDCNKYDSARIILPGSPKFDYDLESLLQSYNWNEETEASVLKKMIVEKFNPSDIALRSEYQTRLQILGNKILKENKGLKGENVTVHINNQPLVIKIPSMNAAFVAMKKEQNNFNLKKRLLLSSRNAVELLRESRVLVTTPISKR